MQPLERLVNLVALLLDSRTPLTFDQIRDKLSEAYGHEDASSAKRMFERDKDVLRDIGVPIEVVGTDVWDAEQGYTIPKDRYYLPEIRFTPEEITALVVAAHSGADTSAEDAVRKLLSGADGGILGTLTGRPSGLDVGADPRLAQAGEAVAGLRRVRFTYRTSRGTESERLVDAHGLVVRGGRWYLVGLDADRGEMRSFRLSRFASDVKDEGPGSEPPEGFRAADHVAPGPSGGGEEAAPAGVAFSPEVAWWATSGVTGAEIVRTREDGWVEIRVPRVPGESLAAWVISFGPDAEALEPAELRAEVVARLEEAGAAR
ncbi:MAG TPA: WYL domain-containing protein [Actinomycetota bacterium]|nr:WYL domain-containing protein [Actinomycetota bacterium]